MAWPDTVPVFTSDDILISTTEYKDGDCRTTLGWLKHLFLYSRCPDKRECIQITVEDRKIYNSVVDKFRKLCIIKGNLHDWEEQTPAKKQATCLNKLCRSLGYTVIEEVL